MSAGSTSFIHNLIETAGGTNVAGITEDEFFTFSMEKLLENDPDIYIINAHSHTPEDIKTRTGYEVLSAVKNDQVFTVDDSLISRSRSSRDSRTGTIGQNHPSGDFLIKMNFKEKRKLWKSLLISLSIALVLISIYTVTIGPAEISFQAAMSIILAKIPFIQQRIDLAQYSEVQLTIIWSLRVPRVILAGLVGGALGVVGASFQGFFKTPWRILLSSAYPLEQL